MSGKRQPVTVLVAILSLVASVGITGGEQRVAEASIADLRNMMETGEMTAVEITRAYLARIEDLDGNVLFEADPEVACVSCELEARGVVLPEILSADGVVDEKTEMLREEQLLSQTLQQAQQIIQQQLEGEPQAGQERLQDEEEVFFNRDPAD